jgi:hypothetical protein
MILQISLMQQSARHDLSPYAARHGCSVTSPCLQQALAEQGAATPVMDACMALATSYAGGYLSWLHPLHWDVDVIASYSVCMQLPAADAT